MADTDSSLNDWLTAIAAPTASPAGGSAAAIAGALGAALVEMVAGLTGSRPKYAAVHQEAAWAGENAARLRTALAGLAVRDAEAFAGFTRALALPRNTADEQTARTAARDAALRDGAAVQLELLEAVADTADFAAAMADRGLAGALGDAGTGALLAAAAARSAYWAVRSNLASMTDAGGGEAPARADELLERVETAERRVLELLRERVR
jgi:glutamate formiminotransferase/formiminotetrahydrofolate cyclodeaminase